MQTPIRFVAKGLALILLPLVSVTVTAFAQPDPGPENSGLRLRLVVLSHSNAGNERHDVRIDLLNTSKQPIRLRGMWQRENSGDLKDYLEAATSIESYPEIAPWVGQVMLGRRTSPQPEYALKAGESLSVDWHTEQRRLKNKVMDQLSVQNPEFPFPGLYSVHATLKIEVGERSVLLLRSNEQLVSIGGNQELPKHSYGPLWGLDASAKTATLGLGSLHKIVLGDEFRITTGMSEFWKLTISDVSPEHSTGRLEPLLQVGPNTMNPNPRFPERYMHATLLPKR